MELNYHGQRYNIDITMEAGEKELDANSDDTDLENTIEIPVVKENNGDQDEIQ